MPGKVKRKPKQKKANNGKRKAAKKRGMKPALVAPGALAKTKVVAAPVATARVTRSQIPQFRTRPNGDVRIVHREYISDVSAGPDGPPTSFSAGSYAINPGQARTFLWLSRVAQNYEFYRFNSLKFEYETEQSSTTTGTVILAIDYDASDTAPSSKSQALAFRNSVRSAPWAACEHKSLAEDLNQEKPHFVRTTDTYTGDIRLYDVGNLFVLTQGINLPNAALGELYVTYDVELMTPTVLPIPLIGGAVTGGGSLTLANPFGTVPVPNAANYGIGIDNKSNINIAFPGTYLFDYAASINSWSGSGFAMSLGGVATRIAYSWDSVNRVINETWRIITTASNTVAGFSQLGVGPLLLSAFAIAPMPKSSLGLMPSASEPKRFESKSNEDEVDESDDGVVVTPVKPLLGAPAARSGSKPRAQ